MPSKRPSAAIVNSVFSTSSRLKRAKIPESERVWSRMAIQAGGSPAECPAVASARALDCDCIVPVSIPINSRHCADGCFIVAGY